MSLKVDVTCMEGGCMPPQGKEEAPSLMQLPPAKPKHGQVNHIPVHKNLKFTMKKFVTSNINGKPMYQAGEDIEDNYCHSLKVMNFSLLEEIQV